MGFGGRGQSPRPPPLGPAKLPPEGLGAVVLPLLAKGLEAQGAAPLPVKGGRGPQPANGRLPNRLNRPRTGCEPVSTG